MYYFRKSHLAKRAIFGPTKMYKDRSRDQHVEGLSFFRAISYPKILSLQMTTFSLQELCIRKIILKDINIKTVPRRIARVVRAENDKMAEIFIAEFERTFIGSTWLDIQERLVVISRDHVQTIT